MSIYNLINHNEHSGLRMFGAFWITVYCHTKSLVKFLIGSAAITCTCALGVVGVRVKQEQVCPSPFCDGINVSEDTLLYALKVLVDNKIRIDVYVCTPLQALSAGWRTGAMCATYQSYGCFVEELGSRFVDNVCISRDTDIGHEALCWASL